MSIGKQVTDCIEKMEASDPEGALFAICAAIEATAVKEFQKAGRESFKNFIHQNLGLITDIAFDGRKILNINLNYEHPRIKKTPEGLCPVQELLYHVVRCGLYHETNLPDDLKFINEKQFKAENGVLMLPSSLIYGLILAVITSSANKDEHSSKPSMFNLGQFQIPISKLWGRRNELLWLLDAVSEVMRLQANISANTT